VLLRRKLAKRLPNELFERGGGIRNSCESALGVALAEAKASERLKGFRPRVRSSRADDATVRRAVGVEETRRRSRARDDEPALVDSEVMSTTERNQILGVVVAAFRPKLDVVRLCKGRVPAARDATLPTVAT
jgi:hypothetical protein